MASWPPPALALGAALAMTTLVWVASLVKWDASNLSPRAYLAVGLVTLWGLRLSLSRASSETRAARARS